MTLKEFLKPSKWKIITSLILTLIWIFILRNMLMILCKMCATELQCKVYYHSYEIIRRCHCDCGSIGGVALDWFWNIIIPFLVVYILYSLMAWMIGKRKL